MFGSDILEVIAGIIFVFVLVSTICSIVREGIEAWFKARAVYLEHGLRELLQDKSGKGIVTTLFKHPLVYGLFNGDYTPGKPRGIPRFWHGGGNLPSYIPARNFALAIMDIAAHGPAHGAGANPSPQALQPDQIRQNVAKMGNSAVQRAVLSAVDTGHGDMDQVRANLEAWYDSAMQRVSGAYRRATHFLLFWIALVITISMNINSLTIADYLYRHTAERNVIISAAEHASKDQTSAYQTARQQLSALHLPIGWTQDWGPLPASAPAPGPDNHQLSATLGNVWPYLQNYLQAVLKAPWDDVFQPLIGWLITAFAATLGAPFWFDLLNKVMTIRSTVKPQ